jgi:hypothetical protein
MCLHVCDVQLVLPFKVWPNAATFTASQLRCNPSRGRDFRDSGKSLWSNGSTRMYEYIHTHIYNIHTLKNTHSYREGN